MSKTYYQVFVSSTYEDLQEERQIVMRTLLELDCIPTGMELFPASDEEQWKLIKRVIDECDYFILILAGRYGSFGPRGVGYTEMEYRYAKSIRKPILSFHYKNPKSLPVLKTDQDPKKEAKLLKFREVSQKQLCRYWSNAHELASVVGRSIIYIRESRPAVGWVRPAVAGTMTQPVSHGERYRTRLLRLEANERTVSRVRLYSDLHWIVVRGAVRMTTGDRVILLKENEASYVPMGTRHCLENPGKIAAEIIEVAWGNYIEADDDTIEADDDTIEAENEE